MSFGREFTKYFPAIANELSAGIQGKAKKEKDEELRRQIMAPLTATIPQPAGGDPGTPGSLNFDPSAGYNWDPGQPGTSTPATQPFVDPDTGKLYDPVGGRERAAQQNIGQTIRTPEYVQRLIEAKATPDQTLSLYKQFPANVQRETADIVNQLQSLHAQGEDIGEEGLSLLESFGKLKRKDPVEEAGRKMMAEDPNMAASIYRIKTGQDPRASAAQQKPPNITTRAALNNAVQTGAINDPTQINAYNKFFDDEEARKNKGKYPTAALNELQQSSTANISALREQEDEIIYTDTDKGKKMWKELSPEERATFMDAGNGKQWRKNPQVRQQIIDEYQHLSQLPERYRMAKEMNIRASDFERAIRSPNLVALYQAWLKDQGGTQ